MLFLKQAYAFVVDKFMFRTLENEIIFSFYYSLAGLYFTFKVLMYTQKRKSLIIDPKNNSLCYVRCWGGLAYLELTSKFLNSFFSVFN